MSSLDMRAYQYQTISSGPDLEITRIFHLAPGAPADPVVGKLLEMNIADPRPFEALSYVWGPDKTTEDIYCDDAALPIRANVAQILRKIRHPTEPRPIWVDQVCINQVNLYERSKQVRHMNTIYRKALRVLVCLGDDDGDGHAEPAFALIRELAGASRDMGLSEEFQTKQRKLQTANPPPDAQWESLTILFQQPWVGVEQSQATQAQLESTPSKVPDPNSCHCLVRPQMDSPRNWHRRPRVTALGRCPYRLVRSRRCRQLPQG